MKRLRPYKQQAASLLKAFSPYLGAILLLAGLAAAFVAHNTHEQQPPTAVEGAADSQVSFVGEAFPAVFVAYNSHDGTSVYLDPAVSAPHLLAEAAAGQERVLRQV